MSEQGLRKLRKDSLIRVGIIWELKQRGLKPKEIEERMYLSNSAVRNLVWRAKKQGAWKMDDKKITDLAALGSAQIVLNSTALFPNAIRIVDGPFRGELIGVSAAHPMEILVRMEADFGPLMKRRFALYTLKIIEGQGYLTFSRWEDRPA